VAQQAKKDVVIIGYGAAAGPISTELTKAGYSVVALERGEYRTTDDFSGRTFDTLRFSQRGELLPKQSEVALTFRSDLNEVARPTQYIMANMVGGASVHWSGQSWRYYEEDFHLRTTLEDMYGRERLAYLEEDGANIQDWPSPTMSWSRTTTRWSTTSASAASRATFKARSAR
jgi:gluconate 2-dehydrogenase alpha chain